MKSSTKNLLLLIAILATIIFALSYWVAHTILTAHETHIPIQSHRSDQTMKCAENAMLFAAGAHRQPLKDIQTCDRMSSPKLISQTDFERSNPRKTQAMQRKAETPDCDHALATRASASNPKNCSCGNGEICFGRLASLETSMLMPALQS